MNYSKDVIFTQNDDLEYRIMKIMLRHIEPIGSGTICEELLSEGIQVGEAKIGRMLRRMDYKNLTKRIGYQGRILTDYGREYLKELEKKRHHNHYGLELLSILGKSAPEELCDILAVRKVLEREAARLAALKATEEEIERLQRIVDGSKKILSSEPGTAEHDSSFHETIADMSKNKVLKSTLNLLVQNKNLHPIFGHIRRRVGSSLIIDHIKILEAIKNRSPEEAEKAMGEHIETVIRDVRKYFNEKREEY